MLSNTALYCIPLCGTMLLPYLSSFPPSSLRPHDPIFRFSSQLLCCQAAASQVFRARKGGQNGGEMFISSEVKVYVSTRPRSNFVFIFAIVSWRDITPFHLTSDFRFLLDSFYEKKRKEKRRKKKGKRIFNRPFSTQFCTIS